MLARWIPWKPKKKKGFGRCFLTTYYLVLVWNTHNNIGFKIIIQENAIIDIDASIKNLKQTNFKLQNLDQVYTRLLNKKIEHAQIKKVNSVTKIIGAQAKILNNINLGYVLKLNYILLIFFKNL